MEEGGKRRRIGRRDGGRREADSKVPCALRCREHSSVVMMASDGMSAPSSSIWRPCLSPTVDILSVRVKVLFSCYCDNPVCEGLFVSAHTRGSSSHVTERFDNRPGSVLTPQA